MSDVVTVTKKGEHALRMQTLRDAIIKAAAELSDCRERLIDARARVKELNRDLHRMGQELKALERERA